jgi:phage terminase large subunit
MDIQFPEKLKVLFEPKRYKVLYGGRGAAKSWGVARALLLLGAEKPLRILCARELQKSIKGSVHELLDRQIALMGLSHVYTVLQHSITCHVTGTEFFFEGIRANADQIKSYEGIDICWVEEAHKVSKTSWDILIPTIRKAGSEIWISFNPVLETDDTYKRFVLSKRSDAAVVRLTWRDNPWFGEVMTAEKELLKSINYTDYLHVWEGECKEILEGAIYGQEMRDAKVEGRLTAVPYERLSSVDVFLDLGRADMTSIWFAQVVNFQYRFFDYYENSQRHIDHYLQVMQNKGYVYGTVFLPHDAKAKTIGTQRSVEEQVRAKGFTERLVPKLSISDGINAARTLFPNCYFDEARCAVGLQCLRHYRYDVDPNTGKFSETPVHDEYSHGADAFRYAAIGLKTPRKGDDRVLAALLGSVKSIFTGGENPLPSPLGWMR